MGRVRVATASLSSQSGGGKKVGVQNGKQLFTDLLGMWEQSRVTQSKDRAADGGTLGGRSLQQGYVALREKAAALSPRASPLQCISAQSAFFMMMAWGRHRSDSQYLNGLATTSLFLKSLPSHTLSVPNHYLYVMKRRHLKGTGRWDGIRS